MNTKYNFDRQESNFKVKNVQTRCIIDLNNVPVSFMNNNEFNSCVTDVLTNIDFNNESQEGIDSVYNSMCLMLVNELNGCSKSTRKKNRKSKPFWNDALDMLWRDMRYKEKKFKKCKNRIERRNLWNDFKLAQYQFDKQFRHYRREYSVNQMVKIESSQFHQNSS